MEAHRPRIIDKILKDELDAMGAVILEGAKACGKTSSAEQVANSVIYMDDPLRRNQYLQMVYTAVGDYAYRRTDGVLVIPIGCLKD